MTIDERLQQTYRRSSRYELVAKHSDDKGQTLLVGYTIHRSRTGLLTTLRRHPEATIALMCPKGDEMVTFLKPASAGATIGEWKVYFSGRTERECILDGERQTVAQYVEQHKLVAA